MSRSGSNSKSQNSHVKILKTGPSSVHSGTGSDLFASKPDFTPNSNDISLINIHPQTPPIPTEHPSLSLKEPTRQRTVSTASSHFSNPRVQNIVPDQTLPASLMFSKPSTSKNNTNASIKKEKNGKLSQERRTEDKLDTKRVLDPRSRAKLDLEPVHDPHQIRIIHSSNYPSTAPLLSFGVSSAAASALHEPKENSSKFIAKQLNGVKATDFDPVDAMEKFMLHNHESVKAVHDKVTAKVRRVLE